RPSSLQRSFTIGPFLWKSDSRHWVYSTYYVRGRKGSLAGFPSCRAGRGPGKLVSFQLTAQVPVPLAFGSGKGEESWRIPRPARMKKPEKLRIPAPAKAPGKPSSWKLRTALAFRLLLNNSKSPTSSSGSTCVPEIDNVAASLRESATVRFIYGPGPRA